MFGSVFLGDPRQRLIASTSPPTSPFPGPSHISPEVALRLRIRWLEALLLGVNDLEDKPSTSKDGNTGPKNAGDDGDETEEDDEQEDTEEQTLIRRAEEIQRRLDNIVLENDDLARFVERCEYF
jgi:hypothetical protein